MALFSSVLFTCTPCSTQPCVPHRATKSWGFSCCILGEMRISSCKLLTQICFPHGKDWPLVTQPHSPPELEPGQGSRAGSGLVVPAHQLQHISASHPPQHCRNMFSLQVKHTISRLLTLLLGSKVNSSGIEFNVCFKEGWKTAITEKKKQTTIILISIWQINNPVWSQMGTVCCFFSYFFFFCLSAPH